jgi:rhodanese-related sulfurtransferase
MGITVAITTLAAVVAAGAVTAATVAMRRFRKADVDMGAREFFIRMLRGRGFSNISPAALASRLKRGVSEVLLVDLRAPQQYAEGHINDVLHRPFDDFLREVVVDDKYADYRNKEVILICDTGHMSRVAGEIMAEDEGFKRVVNLRGGMKQWQRWMDHQHRQTRCFPCSLQTCCQA